MENKETKRQAARKILYLMLALLVGVVIWYYVDETTGVNGGPRSTEREISGIPIIYTNKDTVLLADRGLMLLEEGTDQTVTMTMQGGAAAGFLAGRLPGPCDCGSLRRDRGGGAAGGLHLLHG